MMKDKKEYDTFRIKVYDACNADHKLYDIFLL